MQLSVEILADDIRDFLDFLSGPGRQRFIAGIVTSVWVILLLVILVAFTQFVRSFGYAIESGVILDVLLHHWVLLAAILAVLLMPITFVFLRHGVRQLSELLKVVNKGDLDQSVLRDGFFVGDACLEYDERGFKSSYALAEESYTWKAFERLAETERSLFLMIDDRSGLIVPKRAFPDEAAMNEFRAFAESRIGAAG